jgi:hypothetical protein
MFIAASHCDLRSGGVLYVAFMKLRFVDATVAFVTRYVLEDPFQGDTHGTPKERKFCDRTRGYKHVATSEQ